MAAFVLLLPLNGASMVGTIGHISLGPAPNAEHCSLVGWGSSWHDPALTWDMLPIPEDPGPRRAMYQDPQLCSLPQLHEASGFLCSVRVQAVPHCVPAPGQQQYSPGRGGQARHWSTPQKSPTLPQQSSSLVSPGRGLVHCGERRSGFCGMQRKRAQLAGQQQSQHREQLSGVRGWHSPLGTALHWDTEGPGMWITIVKSCADRTSFDCTLQRGRGHQSRDDITWQSPRISPLPG